jgi:PAS domain S-box-containing protein
VWATDADGQFVFVNAAFESFTGRPRAELLSDRWINLIHPDEKESVYGIYRSAFDARQPFKAEFRLRHSDGDFHFIQFTATPQLSGNRFLGYIGAGTDVSFRRRNQEALRDSETRYRDLAESIGHLFFAVDRQQRFTYWNKACEQTIGMPATAVVGRKVEEIFPQIALIAPAGMFENLLTTRRQETFEYELQRGEQSIPMEVSVYPTRSGISVIAKDISERKNAERALRASETNYRNIFENANDAIVIFEPRAQEILEANSKALHLYGFSRDEFVGMSLKKLTMNIALGERHIIETMESGGITDFETVQFRKDGTPMTLVINASVIEYRGRPAILSVNRDVSHILSVEEVLKSQDNVLQRLLASSDDIVFMQDKDGRYLFYNGSPKFSLGTEEVRGKNPYDFYSPAVARKMMERLYQVISTGKSVSAETQLEWQGETVWFLDQLSPVRNANGDVVSVVTISRNITERKRAEEKLRRSEERYRAFIEQSSDGIWRVEMLRPVPVALPADEQVRMIFDEGSLAECNDVMVSMLGHTVAEALIGAHFGVIVLQDNPQSVEALGQFVLSGYRLAEWESREIDAEGTVHYFSNTFTGILEQEHLVRIWGSRRDISERKRVEREMRLLAQTITSTKDCVSITDLEDRLLFVNEAFLEAYGYAEEELLGKPLAALRSSSMAPEAARQILPATLHGGWYGEVINRRKDGQDLPLELWTSVVRNDEGDPVALVGVARDISDRKRMEHALRQSEARLRRITDAMRDVVTQTDVDGIIRYISPSGFLALGYRPEETLGRPLFEKVHPDDREKVEKAFHEALAKKSGMTLEFRHRHANGDYVWLEAVGNLLFDDQRQVVGTVFGIRDITLRKSAEEQVKTSLEEKEVMLKEIHHRVKNNLQVISSLLSLQSDSLPDESIRKVLRDSQNRVRSMAIIHQRLYQSTNLAEINFAGYIDELSSQLARSYGAVDRNIHLQSKADDIYLGVDKAIPCGIIINELVSNALKYAFPNGDGGTVTIEFHQQGSDVRLVVRDNGIGMPEGLDYQSAESLGLRLVNMLVEQVGGSVRVDDEQEDSENRRGTRWEVRFAV